jgi:ectoine hydroxylase-related dioxygenase (phytanoyl-CoA dioxygenase family)
MQHKIFIDNNLQQKIDEFGYLILNLNDVGIIHQIKTLYNETIINNNKTDLYESSRNNNAETNNYINQKLKLIIQPEAEKLFKEHNFYGGTFMVKTNKFTTELPLHQDWNIVNELQDIVYLIWIPIQDVDENNGSLFLIEKSHLLFENYRSGSFPSIRISRQFIPKGKIKTIRLKVGEYLIYNPAIFHGSYKNRQKQDRVVATAMVTNTNAALTYYHKVDNNNIAAYQLSSSSYLNDITQIANGQVPKNAILLETLQNKMTSIDTNMLLKKLNIQYGIKEKISRYFNAIIHK